MATEKKIAFIGGGNMAEALVRGLLAAEVARPAQLTVTDVSSPRLTALKNRYSISVSVKNGDAARDADIIVLCVKPQVIGTVLEDIAAVTGAGKLVITVAAGVPIRQVEQGLPGRPRVIRMMPNTPALVLAGAAGLATGSSATEEDVALAKDIFGAVGRVVVVDERLMDAVTGLSGSGPAYVFTFIEALTDGGVKAGLPRSLAMELAIQTVLGSARMVLETKDHPAKLRDMVTSPGGTTIAGLHELEKGKFRALVMSAVEAAAKRSRELGGAAAAPKKGKAAPKARVAKPSKKTGKKR